MLAFHQSMLVDGTGHLGSDLPIADGTHPLLRCIPPFHRDPVYDYTPATYEIDAVFSAHRD